jgi:polar amino acid transport system substrate-binding protein
MRTRLGIAVLVVFSLLVSACGDDDDAEGPDGQGCAIEDLNLVEPGVLTIATGEPVFPPWMIDDDPTNQQGFEGAVAHAIAEEMGFAADQVEWVRTDFFEVISVGPKGFDFNIQQYSITAERDEVVDFSDGYYTVQQALVAYADSPVLGAATAADLKQYRLGAALGTTSFDYIEEVIQPDTPAAVYDTNADAKAALDAGQIDALVFDLPTAFYITAVEIPEAAIVGVLEAPGGEPEEFGLLFEDGNSLVTCVNAAIRALKAEGTLAALEAEWLIGGSDLKVITP